MKVIPGDLIRAYDQDLILSLIVGTFPEVPFHEIEAILDREWGLFAIHDSVI